MSNEDRKPERPVFDPALDMEGMPAAPHYNPYLWAGGMSPEAEEGTTAYAGEPKPADVPLATEDQIVEALREVFDPEIPVNIYDLGLIYDMKIQENGDVNITMTLTAPACPVAGQMPGEVAQKAASVKGAGEVTVVLTWDPPWDKDRMSEDARLALGIF
ncbi:MAG: SUF system Fe-S cluster assembly protein [Pseudomonadota bacterium]|uniref:SUF system Fe-S cluster assembly protein n=1 Tax=Fodinicurvata fenggangensis TaxID=1121830 RepID=UPI000AF7451E|nr:SUF system Fe-S cluster assembly protein [Fodinicurvata fenggangensis]